MAGESELFIEYSVVNNAATVYGATADTFNGILPAVQGDGDNLQKVSLIGQSGDAAQKGLESLVPMINAIVKHMQKMQADMNQAIADYQGTDNSLKI